MQPIFPQYSTRCLRARGSDPDTVVLRNRTPDLGKLAHPGRANVRDGTCLAPGRLQGRATFPWELLWLVHGERTFLRGVPRVWNDCRACRNVIPLVDIALCDPVWQNCKSNFATITRDIMPVARKNTLSGPTECQRKTSLSTA